MSYQTDISSRGGNFGDHRVRMDDRRSGACASPCTTIFLLLRPAAGDVCDLDAQAYASFLTELQSFAY